MNDAAMWIIQAKEAGLEMIESPDGKEVVIFVKGNTEEYVWVQPYRLLDENGDVDAGQAFTRFCRLANEAKRQRRAAEDAVTAQ